MGKTKQLNSHHDHLTKIKLLEDAICKQKAEIFQLNSIIWNLPGSIYWKAADGTYLGHNLFAEEIMKSINLEGTMIGKTDYDLFPKEVAEEFRKHDLAVMKTKIAETMEETTRLEDGTEVIQLSVKNPLFDENGNVVGVIGNTIDITARKQAEELRMKHESAKKVIDFTNKVAGSIAHELRTPLTVINLEIDLLNLALSSKKSQQEKDGVYSRTFRVIKETIKSATHVISDMLIKIKSFASGKLEGAFNVASITTDIDEFLSMYPFVEKEKDLIKLKNFDSLKNRFQYLGDSILTKHILSNLLKNALHAVKEAGKGEITFEVRVGDAKDKFNYLIFRDTASGIPQEFVDKIFDQFETKKASGGGTGLGLSFCKMVMETYSGNITCKSKDGEYTEFVLSFPKL
jgi:two-component system, OmpR family, aerobic respiration control sensor histidine kinase ArcB